MHRCFVCQRGITYPGLLVERLNENELTACPVRQEEAGPNQLLVCSGPLQKRRCYLLLIHHPDGFEAYLRANQGLLLEVGRDS
jgi:putative AlgH/UPF0301 family transcriptional regulator